MSRLSTCVICVLIRHGTATNNGCPPAFYDPTPALPCSNCAPIRHTLSQPIILLQTAASKAFILLLNCLSLCSKPVLILETNIQPAFKAPPDSSLPPRHPHIDRRTCGEIVSNNVDCWISCCTGLRRTVTLSRASQGAEV